MDIRQLTTFKTLAHTLNFTRTAAELNYAQSSVTAQIQSLEEELGVPLFDRLGRRVVLTEAGARLLDYAEKILALADEARIAVPGGDEPSGQLNISSNETQFTYRLPPLLREYRTRYPRVRLSLVPLPTPRIAPSVYDGDVDVAFIMENGFYMPNLAVERLPSEPLTLLAPPDHPLANAKIVRPADIEQELVLLTEKGCTYRTMFEQDLESSGVHLSAQLEFANIEVLKQCVMVGMGVGLLPEVVVRQEVTEGKLAALPWHVRDFCVETYMIWRKDRWMSPALRAFMNLARELFSQ